MDRRIFLRGALVTGAAGVAGLLLPGVADAAAPKIYGCADWGARPVSGLTTLDHKADRILIHHMDYPNTDDTSLRHAYQLCKDCQNDHMDHNGWSDTGQHFTVSRGGYRLEGRHGSLSTLKSGDKMIQGAHCPGQNDNAIGIENEGTYMTAQPPEAQWKSLVALCAYICGQYGIPVREIKGHRDYLDTDCPGDKLYSMLPQLRKDVAAAM